jgi:hypothetical protein
MPSHNPFDSFAHLHPSPDELEEAYRRAFRIGQNDVGLTAEEERADRPAALLARALTRMPELSLRLGRLGVYASAGAGDDLVDPQLRAGRAAAAGALRLTVRALELHARDLGYDPHHWLARSLGGADAVCALARDQDTPEADRPITLVREATAELLAALLSLESDRMAVPGHVCDALSDLLVLYLLFDVGGS